MTLLTMSIIGIVLLMILGTAIFVNYVKEELIGLSYTFYFISILGLIILGSGGFGLYASSTIDKIMVQEIVPDTILVSKNKIYIEFDEGTLTYTDMETYNKLCGDTIKDKFYKVSLYNLYNNKKREFKTINKKYGDKMLSKYKQNIKVDFNE